MTSLYPSICIDRLGKQMVLWERYGISDSRVVKLLHLWSGYRLTRFMDSRGRYTFHSFNQLRMQLGYKTVGLMLDDIRRSRSFVLLSCDIDPLLLKEQNMFAGKRPKSEFNDHLTAFFSPLWHAWNECDGEPLEGSADDEVRCRKCDSETYRICDDIYTNTYINQTLNTIPSGGTATAVEAGGAASGRVDETGLKPVAQMTIRQMEELEREEVLMAIAEAKLYFRSLVHHTDTRQREPIEFLAWKLQQPEKPRRGAAKGYGLSLEEAYEVIEILIDKELAPHFGRDKNFMAPAKRLKPEGRIYQVSAYVKKYCQPMMDRACRTWRKRKAERHRDSARREVEAAKRNCPLSPYEWMDAEGVRWMEDAKGMPVVIPSEAEPRPNDAALWNFVEGCWRV